MTFDVLDAPNLVTDRQNVLKESSVNFAKIVPMMSIFVERSLMAPQLSLYQ